MMGHAIIFLAALVIAMPQLAPAETRSIAIQTTPDIQAAQISVEVIPNLSHTRKLPSADLRQARKDMLAGAEISMESLAALARHHDGLAAQKLVQRLLADADRDDASDIAYYGSIAVSTGRIASLRPAIAAMLRLTAETEPEDRIKVYADMLYAHAWAGNPIALDAVIDLNGEGKLFGPLSERTLAKIVAQGEKAGDGRVALRLAVALMGQSDAPPAHLEQARAFLVQAEAGHDLAVKTTATNLISVLNVRMGSQ